MRAASENTQPPLRATFMFDEIALRHTRVCIAGYSHCPHTIRIQRTELFSKVAATVGFLRLHHLDTQRRRWEKLARRSGADVAPVSQCVGTEAQNDLIDSDSSIRHCESCRRSSCCGWTPMRRDHRCGVCHSHWPRPPAAAALTRSIKQPLQAAVQAVPSQAVDRLEQHHSVG